LNSRYGNIINPCHSIRADKITDISHSDKNSHLHSAARGPTTYSLANDESVHGSNEQFPAVVLVRIKVIDLTNRFSRNSPKH
jgi:hypothetical protein